MNVIKRFFIKYFLCGNDCTIDPNNQNLYNFWNKKFDLTSGFLKIMDDQSIIYKVQKNDDEDLKKECLICLNTIDIDEEFSKICCEQYYHKDCLTSWLKIKNKCPVCKESIFILF